MLETYVEANIILQIKTNLTLAVSTFKNPNDPSYLPPLPFVNPSSPPNFLTTPTSFHPLLLHKLMSKWDHTAGHLGGIDHSPSRPLVQTPHLPDPFRRGRRVALQDLLTKICSKGMLHSSPKPPFQRVMKEHWAQ